MTREIRTAVFVVAFAACTVLGTAQVIAFLDLTGVKPQLDLRYPPSPPAKCNKEGVCSGGGYSGMSIACGGAAPGELQVNLTYLDRSEYFDGDTAEIETTIENVGKIPLQIPWTPHLAGLQPEDESAKFGVYELQVGLFLNWGERYSISLGWLNLYGDPTQPGTMRHAKSRRACTYTQTDQDLRHSSRRDNTPALELAPRASAKALFREVEYIPHSGGASEKIPNGGPKETAGTDQPVRILAAFKNN